MKPSRRWRGWGVAGMALLMHGLTLLGLLQLGGRLAPVERARGSAPLALVWVAPPQTRVAPAALGPLPGPLQPLPRPALPSSVPSQAAPRPSGRQATDAPPWQAEPASSPPAQAAPEVPSTRLPALAGQGVPTAVVRAPRDTLTPTAGAQSAEPHVGARPDYAYNPPPDYPLAMREQGMGGVVWLRVWVDGEGRPGEIRLARGSGYRLLDDAAMRAVRHWRFVPARIGDQATASWVEFPIRFALSG